jgi:hypothetical protein
LTLVGVHVTVAVGTVETKGHLFTGEELTAADFRTRSIFCV